MAASQPSKEQIADRLFTVFRDRGFEGASIADLSRATGLGKSSLYHHFPAGKEQMAEAVLERTTAMVDSEILGAAQSSGTLKARIRRIVATLDQIEGIGALARESGMSPVKARHFAEDRVARLQGTLILQAAGEDAGPYKRTMNTLLELSKEDTAPL